MLSLSCRAGVALGVVPRVDATGLAPLRIGNPRTLERLGSRVFDFDVAYPGGEALEQRLWASEREDRRAAFAWRSDWISDLIEVTTPIQFS
jgi:hypothetical protein